MTHNNYFPPYAANYWPDNLFYGIICGNNGNSMAHKLIANNNEAGVSNSGVSKIVPLFPETPSRPRETDNDALLLSAIAQGDGDAFAVLVKRHSTRFYRVAYRFVRARTTAEDIVQDAFIKLWERPALWQADKNTAFTTWFYRIVVNLCLDHAKKKRPVSLADDAIITDDRQSQEEDLIAREKEALLASEIALLPERQRIALNLCFYEELSNQEAADVMGVHLKALQALLMRAKSTLKEKLHFTRESRS